MFVTEEDYIMVGDDALKVLQQSKPEKRLLAEQFAQEEISSRLRGRYDVTQAFAATGAERNMQLVVFYCDIALYQLVCWLPGRMGLEIREKRYKTATEWLDKVQAGKALPSLPTLAGPSGETDINNPVRYGSGQKNNYDW